MDVSRIPPRIPEAITEITLEWLSAALAYSYPGVEVTSVYFGTIIHGTNTKIRLLLTYNEAGHLHRLPPTMWAKCCFEAHHKLVMECGFSEVVFYRDRASEVSVNAPECYFTASDETTGAWFLLLEDLLARNVKFGLPEVHPLTPEIARITLQMLAGYHARWWDNNPAAGRQTPTAGYELVTESYFSEANFKHCTQLPRWQYVPAPLRDRNRFLDAVFKLSANNALGPKCTIHGDPDVGNMFFDPDGTPGFVDWQGATMGCWAHDFAEFILSALKIEDRRANERPLLEFYLAQLSLHGVEAPSFEHAWIQYRRNLFNVATAAVTPVSSRPEANMSLYTERAMTAIMDLDALASFDE